MNEVKALSCPFCGGTKLSAAHKKSGGFRYDNGVLKMLYVVTIRCNQCHARGPTLSEWVNQGGLSSNTMKILTQKAVNKWNSQAQVQDCRNELCLSCGQYKTAHLGSCDGCRWYDMEKATVVDAY